MCGGREVSKQAKKARVIRQTPFDRELRLVEQLVQQFHQLLEQLEQGQRSPEDRVAIATRLWEIRLRELPEAMQSLTWSMKKAQIRAVPLGGGT